MGLRLRRGLEGHARAARRQGRQRRRDDAGAGRRSRPGGLHDHHRGVRRLHEGAARRSPRGMAEQVAEALERLQEQRRQAARRRRGPAAGLRPHAARASRCPGCSTPSSTSGLNDTSVEGLAKATENERFAWDSYRRFVQMFGNVSPRHRRASSSRTRSRRSSPTAASRTTPSSTSTR